MAVSVGGSGFDGLGEEVFGGECPLFDVGRPEDSGWWIL